MRGVTQQEIAAMWLYHNDYAAQRAGIQEFYARLTTYQKNRVDDMIAAICGKRPTPRRKKATR